MRVVRRLSAAAVVLGLLVLAVAAPAGADDIAIREIDASTFPQMTANVIIDGEAPDLGEFQLRENGQILQEFEVIPIGETQQPVGIVLVIDISGSMNSGGALDRAKAAARTFVEQRLANDRIAVVAFGSDARVVVNFTSDVGLLNGAIDGLIAQGETSLYDGVRTAAALFADTPTLQPNLVVLTDGRDTVSSTTRRQAEAAAVDAKATVFTVGIETGDFDPSPLQGLAQATGGRFFSAADPSDLASAYGSVQATLQNQYEVRWTSDVTTPSIEVTISAPGVQATGQTTVGGLSTGRNTQVEFIEGSSGFSVFDNDFGKLLGIGLALAAATGITFVVIMLFVRERSALDTAISAYSGEAEEAVGTGRFGGDLLQQASGFAEDFLERQGLRERVEKLLEQANLPVRVGEALTFYVAIVLVGGILGLVFTQSLIGALVTLVIFALVPPAVLNFLAGRRKKQFMRQLPDMLQLLSGSLRAGYSLMQGVEAVSQEIEDPMGYELRRIVAESRLGKQLDVALDDAATRMGSDDFGWAVMAIKIQREVGGNLAELLDTVAETMLQRERLRREVSALTAEGRISAIILGALPVGMMAILYAINREYIQLLFDERLGQVMLGGSFVMAVLGFYWMKKIIEIEI
ncbi:MAG TPA: VWA domain-containing protein [Acidimicrobiales bacterium]